MQKSMSKGIEKQMKWVKAFNVINLSHSSDKKNRSLSGRRTESKTDKKSGRYIMQFKIAETNDIALDATIRACPIPKMLERKWNGYSYT